MDIRFIAQSAEWAEIKAKLLAAVEDSQVELMQCEKSFDHQLVASLHAKARAAREIYEKVVREIESVWPPDEPEAVERPADARDFVARQIQGA